MANFFDQFDSAEGNYFDQFDKPLSLSEVATQAGSNLWPSAKNLASNIVQPILHPIETGTALRNLAFGVGQKFVPGEQPEEKYADAFGQFFVDRYGSIENAKRTLAEDPVGFVADASMLLTGGGSALARAPGLLGRVGQTVGTVGKTVDPIRQGGRAVGYGASSIIGGIGTHTGGDSLRIAAGAGAAGGARADAFLENLRGNAPMGDVVDDARRALGKIREKRATEYRTNKATWAQNRQPLNFTPIDQALQSIEKVKTFRGVSGTAAAQNISESTAGVRQRLTDTVNQWKALDPAEFHTAEGFDALKQKIGDIRDSLAYGTPERKVVDEVYGAVWKQIQAQSPRYAGAMRAYEEASGLIREIEGTLSLNKTARVDTSLRKLQSLLRNNANTTYGRRLELGQLLVDAGAPLLMEKLAGQALNTLTPRGLGKIVMGGTAAAPAMGLASLLDPTWIATMGVQSPRLMGEAAFYSGKYGYPVGASLFQGGRASKIGQ